MTDTDINSLIDDGKSINSIYAKCLDIKLQGIDSIHPDIVEYIYMFERDQLFIVNLTKYFELEFSESIEAGVFESSLMTFIENGCGHDCIELFDSIYNAKCKEILINLDPHNERVKNSTLLDRINNGEIKPRDLAFLKPWQLNPISWKNPLMKREILENVYDNQATSDLYTCGKCGSKKFKTVQKQTRSADEGVTTFVRCTVCYNTFKK